MRWELIISTSPSKTINMQLLWVVVSSVSLRNSKSLFKPTKIGTGMSSKWVKSEGKLKISGWCHLKGFIKEWKRRRAEDNKAELLDTKTKLYSIKRESKS